MKQIPSYDELMKRVEELEVVVLQLKREINQEVGFKIPAQIDPYNASVIDEEFTPIGFRKLFIEAIVPIFLINPEDKRIIEANPSAAELTGYERKELIGMPISNLFQEDRAEAAILMESIQKQSDLRQFNKTIITKDNSERIVDANYSFYQFRGKSFIQIISVDITERRKAELELKKNNATKNKFFSILGHDLKSPFNSMLGFADILMEQYDDLDVVDQKQYITFIHEGLHNTYRTLENLLYWGRSQMESTEVKPEVLNLHSISLDVIKLLKFPLVNKSIQLNNDIPAHLNVWSDKEMLSAMLRNLVSNAVKFTPRNGRVTLAARIVHEAEEGQFVEVRVSDTGVGIKPEIAEQIFSFESLTSTKGTQNEAGTGLGLTICKEFAEKQGGRIWLERALGEGTTFLFTIPHYK